MSANYGGKTLADIEAGVTTEIPATEELAPSSEAKKPALPGWLTARVPEGESVERYMEHPLNITKSEGLARVLRGLTAMLGSLDYAIVDIAVGLITLAREKLPARAKTEVDNDKIYVTPR